MLKVGAIALTFGFSQVAVALIESAWSCEVDSGPSYVPIEASGAPRARGEDRVDMAQGRTGHRPRTR